MLLSGQPLKPSPLLLAGNRIPRRVEERRSLSFYEETGSLKGLCPFRNYIPLPLSKGKGIKGIGLLNNKPILFSPDSVKSGY